MTPQPTPAPVRPAAPPLPASPLGPRFPRLARSLRRGAFVLAADVAITLVIWLINEREFWHTMVFAQCIGLCTWGLVEAGLPGLPRDARGGVAGGRALTALMVGACAGGYVVGNVIGSGLVLGRWWPFDLRQPLQLLTDAALAALFGLAVVLIFVARERAAHHREHLAEVERQATLARLAQLQSQLEPHMLFNTLANLRVLIGVDPPAAQAMLDRLNDFLRATLAASRATEHPLSDEFARVDDYLALMRVRMGERLRVRLDLPRGLGGLPVPPMLLQPLVENAIQHGLEPRRGPGELVVSAAILAPAGAAGAAQVPRLRLRVEDSGRGLDEAARAPAKPASGFGLVQVRERLRTLHGDAATLRLGAREGGGTVAEVELPMPARPDLLRPSQDPTR